MFGEKVFLQNIRISNTPSFISVNYLSVLSLVSLCESCNILGESYNF